MGSLQESCTGVLFCKADFGGSCRNSVGFLLKPAHVQISDFGGSCEGLMQKHLSCTLASPENVTSRTYLKCKISATRHATDAQLCFRRSGQQRNYHPLNQDQGITDGGHWRWECHDAQLTLASGDSVRQDPETTEWNPLQPYPALPVNSFT